MSTIVVSDLTLRSTSMTLDRFSDALTNGMSMGFGAFSNFIAGDYTYKSALFRAQMTASTANEPRLMSLAVDVDVPDVIDRGSVAFAGSGAINVTFARKFYVIPQVVATQQGGTAIGSIKVTNVTLEGFTIQLLAQDGSNLAGAAAWTATGY